MMSLRANSMIGDIRWGMKNIWMAQDITGKIMGKHGSDQYARRGQGE